MAGRINLRGYDPRLAEEADQRQKEFAQNQLGQIGELGSIQTQGIKGLGETASDAVTGGVNSYLEGQKIARDKEAHALRVKLAQQNLDSQAAEEKLLNASYNPLAAAQAEEGSPEKPLTNAQQLFNLKLQKLKTEAQAPRGKSVFSGSPHVSASGIPMRFNSETGTYEEAGNVPVRTKDDRRGPPKLQQTQFTGADGAPLLYNPDSGEYTPAKTPGGVVPTKPKDEIHEKDKLDSNARAYADRLAKTNVPAAVAQLEKVYGMLPPEGEAPGYGRVAGILPDALVSQKGEDLRQGVQAIFNIELKDRSGAAVSDQELDRLKREFGQGSWKTADQLRKGLIQYENRLKEVIRNINAGEDPEVTKEYVKRGGKDFGNIKGRDLAAPGAPAGGAQKTPVKKQYSASRKMTRVTYSDGSIEEIPDGGR